MLGKMQEDFGLILVVFILGGPLLGYPLIRRYARKQKRWAIYLYDRAKREAVLITILYFFITSAFIAIISPVFVEKAKEGLTLSLFVESLNLAGILLGILALPIVISSYFMDAVIKKVGQYKHFLGGYIDPVTGHPNISLRYDTFANVVAALQDPKKIGAETGDSFAKSLISIPPEINTEALHELASKWTEADEKAGWCTHIECNFNTSSLQITDSFALRRMREGDKYPPGQNDNLCKFLIGYAQGVMSHELGKSVEMDCMKNCTHSNSDKICAFSWKMASS